MCGWNTFGAQTSHEHPQTHKTHHNSNLGEANTFPFIVFSMINHGGCIQMSFCLGTPKLGVLKHPKLGFPKFWRAVTSCVNLQLKWGLKHDCSLHQNIFNDMWHAIYKHIFQGDYGLLVGGSQIDTSTFNLSFGHNLCSKYSNGSCEPILNICGTRNFLFQWILITKILLWKFRTL